MRYKILIIDDHKGTRETLKMLLNYENYSVITAEKGKTTSHIPIMLFTGAMTTPKDEVYGFKMGACEYITKPFDPGVLVARLNNIFREREKRSGLKETIKKCGLEIFEDERYIKIKGKIIELTQTEIDILLTLLKQYGQAVRYEYLSQTVFGYEKDIITHNLETHIYNLRKKLGPDCAKYIITIKGVGYKLQK